MLAHEILGLRADAGEEEVRHRFRELAQKHHPDHGGDPHEFVRVKSAYDAMMSGSADRGFESPRQSQETPNRPHEAKSDEWFSHYKEDLRHQWEAAGEAAVESGGPVSEGAGYYWMPIAIAVGAGFATWRAVDRGAPSDAASMLGQLLINGILLLLPAFLCGMVGGGSDEGAFKRVFFCVAALIGLGLALVAPLPGFRPQRDGSPPVFQAADPFPASIPVSGSSAPRGRRGR